MFEDPKTSADENEPQGDHSQENKQGAPESKAQDEQERLKRFIWYEGDFEFEDDA